MSVSSTECPWRLIQIDWEDAFDSPNGWIDLDEYEPKVARFRTVGYLVPDMLAGYHSVTSTWDPDELPDLKTIGCVTHILDKMITRVQYLT